MEFQEFRRKSRKIRVGRCTIGGDAPISVQSMTNTDSRDVDATLRQVLALEKAGCDIVRLAVPSLEAVPTIAAIKEAGCSMPLVADIHFDYRIALACADAGVDKIRINPGNIGEDARVHEVVKACRLHNIPIRIGVNSGSLEKHILQKYGAPTAEALAESAMYHVRLLEKYDFDQIIIAVKSSDPHRMAAAMRLIAAQTDYPLHLGVTEAGTPKLGILKSAAGIGGLLCDGIGDTIRISLTADPLREVEEGRALLRALGLENNTIELVSCPTCGRTCVDLIGLAEAFEARMAAGEIHAKRPLKVAIMGCVVNGPGEAREADIGVAGGHGEALLFRRGEIVRKIPESEVVDVLIREINAMT